MTRPKRRGPDVTREIETFPSIVNGLVDVLFTAGDGTPGVKLALIGSDGREVARWTKGPMTDRIAKALERALELERKK